MTRVVGPQLSGVLLWALTFIIIIIIISSSSSSSSSSSIRIIIITIIISAVKGTTEYRSHGSIPAMRRDRV